MAHRERLKALEKTLFESLLLFASSRRKHAAEELAQDGSPEAMRILAQALVKCPDQQVHQIALNALQQLTDQACIDAVCAVWADTRSQRLQNLLSERYWIASYPPELNVLTALNVRWVQGILEATPGVVEPLMKACDDSDPAIAQRAHECLRNLKNVKTIDTLCSLWSQYRTSLLRRIIIDASYVARRPIATRVLTALLTKQQHLLRTSEVEIVAPLIQACRDVDPTIAESAIILLLTLENQEAIHAVYQSKDIVGPLITAWKKFKPDLARRAQQYLLQLSHPQAIAEFCEHKESVDILLSAYQEHDPAVAQNVHTLLANLRHPEAINTLCSFWTENRDPVLEQIIQQAQFVAQKPVSVRVLSALCANALHLLAETTPDMVNTLVPACEDVDPLIAQRARQVVRQIAHPKTQEALYNLVLQHDYPIVREIVLTQGGERFVTYLIEALQYQPAEYAERAHTYLEQLKNSEAVDALCRIWAEMRSPVLGQVIARMGYLARAPLEIHILSMLQANRLEEIIHGGSEVVYPLTRACHDVDEHIAERASMCLSSLQDYQARDAVCVRWEANQDDAAIKQAIIQGKYVARQPITLNVLTALLTNQTELLDEKNQSILSPLISASEHADATIAQRAQDYLKNLHHPETIDALCGYWAATSNRNPVLTQIISVAGYVARQPAQVRFLTALQTGKIENIVCDNLSVLQSLMQAALDTDAHIAQSACRVLLNLQESSLIDALCMEWAKTRNQVFANMIAQARYVAREPMNVCVLSALQANRLDVLTRHELVEIQPAENDPDQVIASRAKSVLRKFQEQDIQEAKQKALKVQDNLSPATTQTNYTKRPIYSTVRCRLDFGKIPVILDIPNLIEVQQQSYERFLQLDVAPDEREDTGLQEIFKSVFPISDYNEMALLEFVSYTFGKPKYGAAECRERGMTYSIPLKVTVRLVTWDYDLETKTKSIRDIKEEDIYFGEIPMMMPKGTFIINGVERTVVSQMHRSPGVFFDHDKGKGHFSGKVLYSCRVIPYRGSWLELEFDYRDYLYVRIDRNRKIMVSTFLRAMYAEIELILQARELAGPDADTRPLPDLTSTESILRCFYDTVTFLFDAVDVTVGGCSVDVQVDLKVSSPDALSEFLRSYVAAQDVIAPDGTVIIRKDKKITRKVLRLSKMYGINTLPVYADALLGAIAAKDIIIPYSGEILVECNEEITREALVNIAGAGIRRFDVLLIDKSVGGDALSNTFMQDTTKTTKDALLEIYRVLRPRDPPTENSARKLFHSLFFDPDRYDLSKVGRLKVNEKLRLNKAIDQRTLDAEDLIAIISYMLKLRMGESEVDDIDHLGNRRVRSVGELLENQFRMGLMRVERATKERMSLEELYTMMPEDAINAKPVITAVREFFDKSPLSYCLDQTNPLSGLSHKRCLSALGPGGLGQGRAGFEMCDVHPTHYGRICPIETTAGPDIGLFASLSTYGRINAYGFIETPYRKIENGRATETIEYLSAFKDEQFIIAQANAPIDENGNFLAKNILARNGGEFVLVSPEQVDYMDVSPKQLVSVSASLIPFLEHDDINRALMGANMQRQAVPLLKPEAPLVGTGMETVVARKSGSVILAKRSGVIESVDSRSIVIRVDESLDTDADQEAARRLAAFQISTFDEEEDEKMLLVDRCDLMKFQRSNQNTCINQRPLVKIGDRVKAGQVIADGFSTDQGELALGRNLLVAFMPWEGYNFEEAILINERVVKGDMFTSIHIEECEIEARDTKLGREEITRDIPNVGEDALVNLDESGIVRIGAEVRPGDILVGKVSPKGESHLAPEEKLLRAIFGEHVGDVKDASLRTPQGVEGIVIDVKVFSRKGMEKDERSESIEEAEIAKIVRDYEDEIRIVREELRKKLVHLLKDKTVAKDFYGAGADDEDDDLVYLREDPINPKTPPLLKKGDRLTPEKLEDIPIDDLTKIKLLEIQDIHEELEAYQENAMDQIHILETIMNEKTSKLRTGDELPPGVVKLIKVYIAMKRRLSVGDKMAGRHGNKGVVAKIAPVEDMPFLADGTPVDIVLNPLGIPSRGNVGQILETCLGWASKKLMEKLTNYTMWLTTPLAHLEKHVPELQEILALVADASDEARETAFREIIEERLRTLIDRLYTGIREREAMLKFLKQASREGLVQFARHLQNNVYFATPVFDGASEDLIKQKLEACGLSRSGKVCLYDGKTGEAFDQEITVGYMYIMKTSQLVDDKIHARSIGPYSLVTQQPLGGRAQFGGQRFGEMEIWALQAYGAAYNLQELLTVKSDDVVGRTKMYESIVKGQHRLEPGIPESFNVLVKEIQSLGFAIDLIQQ